MCGGRAGFFWIASATKRTLARWRGHPTKSLRHPWEFTVGTCSITFFVWRKGFGLARSTTIAPSEPATGELGGQIQSDGQFLRRGKILALHGCRGATLLRCRSPFYLCFEHVGNLGAYRIPSETGLLIPSGFTSVTLGPTASTSPMMCASRESRRFENRNRFRSRHGAESGERFRRTVWGRRGSGGKSPPDWRRPPTRKGSQFCFVQPSRNGSSGVPSKLGGFFCEQND